MTNYLKKSLPFLPDTFSSTPTRLVTRISYQPSALQRPIRHQPKAAVSNLTMTHHHATDPSTLKRSSLSPSNSPFKKSKLISDALLSPQESLPNPSSSPSKETNMTTSQVSQVQDRPLLVKKLSEFAQLPKRGSPGAAGYDLCSAHDSVIPAKGKAIVPTDLSIALPEGTYGRVAPRSGLAVKHFLDVGAGVVDMDYRGPLGVVMFNFSDKDFEVKRGDRIAQLVIERIAMVDVMEVEDLDETVRGEGGFGSTGVSTCI